MVRIAGECGMSRGLGTSRSRKVPLCGPMRDKDARARLDCMISPARWAPVPARTLAGASAHPRDRAKAYTRERPDPRSPSMVRIAGECGMSRGLGTSRSRKVPLCGPMRDKDARARLDCMVSPAARARHPYDISPHAACPRPTHSPPGRPLNPRTKTRPTR
jgi:hypothetical protein